MPSVRSLRRRTPSEVLRRRGAMVLVPGLVVAISACSGGSDEATPRGVVGASTAGSGDVSATTEADGGGTPSLTFSSPSRDSALLNYPHVVAAMAVVPVKAAVVSFTDLDLLKKRLGYADVTSESPTPERFDFWERVRADGAAFTGTRLYDAASEMALDYGWTGEDVAWEVDFAVTEEGCFRSMLCQTAHGYALGLDPDLDWSVVTKSLENNGFEQDGTDPDTYRTDDPKAPFGLVHLVPELHAVAGGNEIGVKRLADVVEGAPPIASRIGAAYDRLGTVESLRLTDGCVDLPAALGLDATDDDVSTFLKQTAIGDLETPASTTVAVSDRRRASIEVDVGAGATEDDLATRTAAIRSWPGLQNGTPFADVAEVTGSLHESFESYTVDVAAMPAFRAMVLTDDAPWALCPYVEPR